MRGVYFPVRFMKMMTREGTRGMGGQNRLIRMGRLYTHPPNHAYLSPLLLQTPNHNHLPLPPLPPLPSPSNSHAPPPPLPPLPFPQPHLQTSLNPTATSKPTNPYRPTPTAYTTSSSAWTSSPCGRELRNGWGWICWRLSRGGGRGGMGFILRVWVVEGGGEGGSWALGCRLGVVR
jgi:hypothetical protein